MRNLSTDKEIAEVPEGYEWKKIAEVKAALTREKPILVLKYDMQTMLTDTQQLLELKDYKDKLFQKEGGRADVMSDEGSGMHKAFSSWFGPLHPSKFCGVCGKCYNEPKCFVGYLLIAGSILFDAILSKVRGET